MTIMMLATIYSVPGLCARVKQVVVSCQLLAGHQGDGVFSSQGRGDKEEAETRD